MPSGVFATQPALYTPATLWPGQQFPVGQPRPLPVVGGAGSGVQPILSLQSPATQANGTAAYQDTPIAPASPQWSPGAVLQSFNSPQTGGSGLKWIRAVILGVLLLVAGAFGQSDNSIHVKDFAGVDVGAKVANAMTTCPAGNVPCILIVDASLAAWPAGTMPTLCANCSLLDYRQGSASVTSYGSIPYASGYPSAGCTVNGTNYPRQVDCAIQTLLAYSAANHVIPVLHLSAQTYLTDYGLHCTDQVCISIAGEARSNVGSASNVSALQASPTFPIGQPVISHAATAGNGCNGTGSGCLANWRMEGFTIDGGGRASSCFDGADFKVSRTDRMQCQNLAASDHWWENGIGDGEFQDHVDDLFLAGQGNPVAQWANVTAAGSTPVFTVVSGGSYRNASPPVEVMGHGSSLNSAHPCTVMGTATAVMSGTGPFTVASISSSGFSGCSGSIYVSIPDLPSGTNGFVNGATDSTLKDVAAQFAGQHCGIKNLTGATYQKAHAWEAGWANFCDFGSATWIDTDMDSGPQFQFDIESSPLILGGESYWNGSYPGAADFFFGSNTLGANIRFHACTNSQTSGGYAQFVDSGGPLVPGSNSPAEWPAGVVIHDDEDCLSHQNTSRTSGGIQEFNGNLNLNWVVAPSITVTPNTTGTTTYTYGVFLRELDGSGTLVKATITNGASTPNNTITVPYNVAGVAYYDYYCVAGCSTLGKLNSSPAAATTWTDTTGHGDGSAVPSSVPSGRIAIAPGSYYFGPCSPLGQGMTCISNSSLGTIYRAWDTWGQEGVHISSSVTAASTITSTGGFFHVTGSTAIQTINVSGYECSNGGYSLACFQTIVFDTAGASLVTGGNIVSATPGTTVFGPTTFAGQAVRLVKDTNTGLWYPEQ